MDATPIFDDVDTVIYADSCCHYNDKGNQILAAMIVNKIESVLSRIDHSAQAVQ